MNPENHGKDPHPANHHITEVVIDSNQPALKVSSFVVFWMEGGEFRGKLFACDDSSEPLRLCEDLRRRRKNGELIGHVSISSDLIDNVTVGGVSDELPKDYNWTMRRRTFLPGRDPKADKAWTHPSNAQKDVA